MNEISLSNDLNVISAEIKTWKSMAGMSLWEIGRRLKHVKDNDLAHGEYINWLTSVGIERSEAYRYVRIAEELPNDDTWQHLSSRALYLVATLPEEERAKEHETDKGEIKTPDEMTIRELERLNKEIKRKDAQISLKEKRIKSLTQVNENLEFKANQPPNIIEKEVVKEVKPHDYDNLKSDNHQLSSTLKQVRSEAEAAKNRNKYVEEQLKELYERREQIDKNSKEYEELKAAIQRMQGQMNVQQQKIAAYSTVADSIKKGNDLLDNIAPLAYTDDLILIKDDSRAVEEINRLVQRIDRWVSDMNQLLSKSNIIEGEIINDN